MLIIFEAPCFRVEPDVRRHLTAETAAMNVGQAGLRAVPWVQFTKNSRENYHREPATNYVLNIRFFLIRLFLSKISENLQVNLTATQALKISLRSTSITIRKVEKGPHPLPE